MILGVSLVGVWLLWSGHYDPLMVALGLVSTYAVLGLCLRMDIIDEEAVPAHVYLHLPGYGLWLIKEIIVSSLVVAGQILRPRLRISPTLARFPALPRTAVGQVILANSITLTPGTITIRLRDGQLLVHALTRRGADGLLRGAMNRRVAGLEKRP
jgi:multicomponent Na+:H+ antiporter subunit E